MVKKSKEEKRRDEINARPGNDIHGLGHCVTGDFANRSPKFLSAEFFSITIILQTNTYIYKYIIIYRR